MTSILEELFYGNVCPSMDFRSQDVKARKLMKHLANHHEALNDTLTEKQQELLEKFDDCYCCYAIELMNALGVHFIVSNIVRIAQTI